MESPMPQGREVAIVRGLFTADDVSRRQELIERTGPDSFWQVEIRTARVLGRVIQRVGLGGFPMTECMCLDLKLDRPVPVEPGLRFRIYSEIDATLTATGVIRPWDA
jgi:hypothetical protein